MSPQIGRPSNAFVAASWAALCIGSVVYLIGLWNAQMQLNEKGYYLTLLAYGLFSAISLQKTVRDKLEGVAVTGIYYGISWVALIIAVTSLSSVGFFTDRVARALKLEANQLLGGDLVLVADHALKPEWRAEATRRGLRAVESASFTSMALPSSFSCQPPSGNRMPLASRPNPAMA